MGANRSKVPQDPEQSKKSRAIDKEIHSHRIELGRRNHVKVLILGAGDAGKSTVIKQMRILHIQGFSTEDRLVHKSIIFTNLLESMRVLLECLQDRGIELPRDKENYAKKLRDFIRSGSGRQLSLIQDDISESLIQLWSCDAVKNSVLLPGHFQLDDSTSYFYAHLERILSAGYEPTEEDVIRSRVRTTGIVEIRFKLEIDKKTLDFQMFDVGGQRSERRKWIHCFEGVTAVLFIAPLAEFDQTLFEDTKTNRMRESLELFGQIVNNPFFIKSNFILFLNKKDIFLTKLEMARFSDYFPAYSGENEASAVMEYIKEMYMSKIQRGEAGRTEKEVYTHFTNATDTRNIQHVFHNVCDIIVKKLLGDQFY